ncbi:MAG TPA: folylpolyglutamate synthase/dihydrofolate synthase family protein [Actinomycetota bacterium]|nr:folylpolyglutamate synthase/dihydrofolate synthase family protein [Actinomycetota bacterium]
MRFAEAAAGLEARGPGRMVPDLDRIRALAELLDHPERTYPVIHVAGTNGKTTTARLIARILCAHGLATGVYTSPHLQTVRERLALCDELIPEDEFAETYAHLRPFLDEVDGRGEPVTYFEALTAMGFLWFADKPVDAAVFEVGMGGTWDATNIADAKVAVVRSIGLDHPELGSTVQQVAGEKAGVIKEGTTVIADASEDPAAREVIAARSEEVGASLLVLGSDVTLEDLIRAVGGQVLHIGGTKAAYKDLFLPLHGGHQAENAAAAIAACEVFLGQALSEDALREALAGATSPGRLEVVSRHPLVVLDGAHNPHAARALAPAVDEAFTWAGLHLVVGILETKDAAGVVSALAPVADATYACANSHERSLAPEQLATVCREAGLAASAYPDVGAALDAAETAAGDDDLILVTGSLYTVADARPRYVKD